MPNLSDPLRVRGLYLRNRLVMAPTATGLAQDAAPSPAQIRWYRDHARSGVGLVVVESCAVDPDARIMAFNLGLWEDAQIPGMASPGPGHPGRGGARGAAARPRRGPLLPDGPGPGAGGRVGGGAASGAGAPAHDRRGESWRRWRLSPRRRAGPGGRVRRGGDPRRPLLPDLPVPVPVTNRRTDRWGGDRAGRAALALATARAVRRAVGPDCLISCRMHSVERFEGGLGTEDAVHAAQALEAAGVDLLDLSGIGTSSMGEWQGQPYLITSSLLPKDAPGGAFGPSAGRIRAAVGIPVVTVGKLSEPGAAQAVLDQGQADLVALSRPLIADPLAASKLLAGQDDAIIRCKECLSCFAAIRKGPIKCSVNPAV